MKISVEEISSVKKSIKIEIPKEAVSQEFSHALEHLQREIRMPGFRPGKAPLALLAKKYEGTLQEEMLRKLIPEYCQRAIEQTGLSPVELPHIQNVDFKKGTPSLKDASLSFTVLVDILPEIRLSTYTGLTLPHKEISVTEEEVEKGLAAVQEQEAFLENLLEDHPIGPSDYVIIDFVGETEGKPLKGGKKEGYPIRLGSKMVRPEVEAALLSRKKGESLVVETAVPGDDPEPEVAGKAVLFKIDIKEVKGKRLPPLDDELAKDLGLSSFLELKEKVKTTLVAERAAQQKQEQKNHLINKLIALHPIEAPESMIEGELRSLLSSISSKQKPGVTEEGLDPQQIETLREVAKMRVKGYLILKAIADQEKIAVSDSDLSDAIKRLTEKAGIPFEKGKTEIFQSPDATRGLKAVTLEEKTMEWLFAHAQFEPIEEKVQ